MISKDVGTIAVIYYLLLLIAAFNGIPKKGFSSCRVESVILTDLNTSCAWYTMAASIYVISLNMHGH